MSDTPLFDIGDAPGGEPGGTVHAAYASAVKSLRESGVLKIQHEGLAANLLRLGTIIDHERKGYAVAHATGQAHEIMKTLLALAPVETGDEFLDIMKRLEATAPGRPAQ